MILHCEKDLIKLFTLVEQPRSEFAIRNLIVGTKDSTIQCLLQAIAELRVRHFAIKRIKLTIEQYKVDKNKCKRLWGLLGYSKSGSIRSEQLGLDIIESEITLAGSEREYDVLFSIVKGALMGKDFTIEEIEADQPEYWRKRLTRQAVQEIEATGRLGIGNKEALHHIGLIPERNYGELFAEIVGRTGVLQDGKK